MKKAFALILATAMCLATLTACGGKAQPIPQAAQAPLRQVPLNQLTLPTPW